MAAAAVCPVVGTSTTVLPPGHPAMSTDPEARCPVRLLTPPLQPSNFSNNQQPTTKLTPSPQITNAKVAHHDSTIIHNHPSSPSIPTGGKGNYDAEQCPAVKSMAKNDKVENEICPVVGPVSAFLPPTHPALTEKEAGKICPVTNAKLEHHEGKVHMHPAVANDAEAGKCPVAGNILKKQAV
ncbi:hypothetical protein LTR62_004687 [Meristemomyces frigidus]|uniref:Uncharacterized protein n=1 Tax=Meristemomyces frigidus TaxID=1508187 RepID=A0AAN7YR88_9PEZI|nr:hypothetical protein LTR62_004687 [Meristemomyces frigidus]